MILFRSVRSGISLKFYRLGVAISRGITSSKDLSTVIKLRNNIMHCTYMKNAGAVFPRKEETKLETRSDTEDRNAKRSR